MGALEPDDDRGVATPADLQRRIVAIMFGEPPARSPRSRSCASDVERHRATSGTCTEQTDAGAGRASPPRAPAASTASQDISLSVRGGEILGIAGVDGNGQRALAEVIAGQRRVERRATSASPAIAPSPALDVSGRQRLGLRYVTDDRLGEGVVARYSRRPQPRAQAHRRAPYWRRGASTDRPSTPPPTSSSPSSTSATPVARHPHRPPVRRQHPEGAARAGAVVRAHAWSCSTSPRTASTCAPSRMVRERIRSLAERGRGDHRHLHRPR